MISEGLGKNETELFDLKKNKKIDPSPFEKIIVGGSIHAGAIPKKLHSFLNKNQDILLKKSLGLFLCCMYEKEAWSQFNQVYPSELREHARSKKCVGGEFLFENMNFIEKAMIKKIAGTKSSEHKLDEQKIKELIEEMRA